MTDAGHNTRHFGPLLVRRRALSRGARLVALAFGLAAGIGVGVFAWPSAAPHAERERDASVEPLLTAALRADDSSAREALAHTLRLHPAPAATDAMLALLGDDAVEVRLAAAESLEARADRRAMDRIAALVDDEEDLDVERALRRALRKMSLIAAAR